MIFKSPRVSFSPYIRALWQEAFGDVGGFLDQFEKYACDPKKFRTLTADGKLVSAHYIFDCEYCGGRVAYIYGVATKKEHRGKGYSTAMLTQTHRYLKEEGYAGAILVPQSPSLFAFYERLGYKVCSHVTEISATASGKHLSLYQINAEEYMARRKEYLPYGAVLQDKGVMLDYIASDNEFFFGDGFILAARELVFEDGGRGIFGTELLGNTDRAGDILTSLGHSRGIFRTVGEEKPFAAYLSFNGYTAPRWFAFEM